jgi:hypothetical protein
MDLRPPIAAVLLLGIAAAVAAEDPRRLEIAGASEQAWGGGFAGAAGTRYVITLVSGYPEASIRIGGLWVDDTYVPLELRNISVRVQGELTRYEITCGVDRSSLPGLGPGKQRVVPPLARPRPHVAGRAVLDVFVDGKEHPVAIQDFAQRPGISYP